MESQIFPLATFDSTTSMAFVSLLLGIALVIVLIKVKPMPQGAKFAASGMVIAVLGLLSWVFLKAHNANVRLTPTAMMVDIPLYGVELSLESLLPSQASIINLDDEDAPQISYRSNGVGLPGYQLGWFKLAKMTNNTDKALLSATNSQQVLVLPTTEGYLLLLSVERPEALLSSLLTPTL